jgi:hypothetical protein
MFRAGSTVQYQIACHLVEQWFQGTRMGILGLDCLPEFRREAVDNRWRVLKVHDWHQSLAAIVAEGRGKCFYTYRDIRDVVYSVMHKRGITFDEVAEVVPMILENDRLWRTQPTTLVQRYEDTVRDRPAATAQMAAFLGVTLSREQTEQIADAYSLDANRERTKELASRLRQQGHDLDDPANIQRKDKQTELHWNHIRSGNGNSWRDLASAQQVETLRRLCTSWLIENGYERDEQWSAAATA